MIATIGISAMVSHLATVSRAPRSSEWILENLRASIASWEAWESAPTAVTRKMP